MHRVEDGETVDLLEAEHSAAQPRAVACRDPTRVPDVCLAALHDERVGDVGLALGAGVVKGRPAWITAHA